jgi:hypothetical protein
VGRDMEKEHRAEMKEEIRDKILKALRKRPLTEAEIRGRLRHNLNGADLYGILLGMMNDGLIDRSLRSRAWEYSLKVDYDSFKKRIERFKKLEKEIGWLGAFSVILGK